MASTIDRITIESSSLASLGYAADEGVLEAEFRNGDVYRFFLVPANLWKEFLNAHSKGAFFNSRVRDRYPHAVVKPDAPKSLEEELQRSLAAFRRHENLRESPK